MRRPATVVITTLCAPVPLNSAKSICGGKRRESALNTALRCWKKTFLYRCDAQDWDGSLHEI